ncbi:cytosolic phospholipase A2 gamma-like [Neoarius graeffei]|uniref:cytosolic phospholipase A2 gamma-like n=1 Tax=Neoarius graeffei TaxID=443677 RepID=UPI00298D0000|nr:cytosolic phospholipase A2 gamma-like [Neoarius graeffei]
MSQSKPIQRTEVRIGHSLNEGEQDHVSRRGETVLQCLKRHGINCSQDTMPNIALLGSGGGERAMLGLLGSLVQLKNCDLLDSIMYLSGVSGSTWCMTSLYKESDWSTKLAAVKENIIKRLDGPAVSWSDAWKKLNKYYDQNDNFSLTDVWAVMFVTMIMKEIDENTISGQRENHSKDPYPVYTVIDKQCKKKKRDRDVWFEVAPHEAGYSLAGAFVDSAYFGSQFEEGRLVKKQPEIDMLYLQGLCGSALASKQEIQKWLWEHIKVEDVDPSVLSEEERNYMDAGLLDNSPYFPMLRKERHIDLFISLDFSSGDPMETVVKASEMCRELKIPFPEVKPPPKSSEPDDFYCFEGKNGAPTVIHIPLFNKVNCDGHIKEWETEYTTFQGPYSGDMIIKLIEKAGENVINNKGKLMRVIRSVTEEKGKTQ